MKPNYLDFVDIEFKDVVSLDCDNDSGFPELVDSRHPRPTFCEATDDIAKFFQAGHDEQELQKLNRSRMAPTRNTPQEDKPEETSCEDFFDCKVEKRASSFGRIRLFKRLIAETNEVAIEGFNAAGECCYTRFVSVDAVDEGSPLAKAASLSISGEMRKTLNEARAWMTSENIELAEKAIRSLDVSGFLAIIRAAKSVAA